MNQTWDGESSILLTAIVSTYNAADYLHGCLEDLEAQTVADRMEIIVIDSASQQNEAEIVEQFRARYPNINYIRTPSRESVYQAWNRGIRIAKGKYITNANTDDRHRRDAFEQMISVMEENEDIALVYADVIKTRTDNETFNQCTPTGVFRWPDWDRKTLLTRGCFIGPQPVWRRRVHEQYGYFDENYEISSDFEFWLRISQTHDFYHFNTPLGLYLERADSVEHSKPGKKRQEDNAIFEIYRYAAANHIIIGLNAVGPIPTDDGRGLKSQYNPFNHAAPGHRTAPAKAGTKQGDSHMNSPDTILKAIQDLIATDQKEAAAWALGKLMADFPADAQLHDQAATMAFDMGDLDAARGFFESAAQLSPENAAYQKSLGDFYYVVHKDAEKAIKQYELALNLEDQSIDTLIMAGHVALTLHRYADAQRYYTRALALDPGNVEVRDIVDKMANQQINQPTDTMKVEDIQADAAAKAQAGDHSGAITSLELLVGRQGDQALVHNDLGVLYYECGNIDKALEHYERATSLEPENEIYQKNLADIHWNEKKDPQRAMEIFVQVLKLNPHDVDALLSCGQICIILNKVDDAWAFIDSVLKTEPWNEDAQQMSAQLEKFSATAIASDGDGGPDRQMINGANSNGLGAEINALIRKIAQSPLDAVLHNDLGVLYYEAGEKEKAVASYKEAVRLNPGETNYQKNLADFYLVELGQVEEAMKLYLQVLSEYPQDVEALNATGMICTALGKVQDARYFYERVLEIEPWNEDAGKALTHLTQAFNRQGDERQDVRAVG